MFYRINFKNELFCLLFIKKFFSGRDSSFGLTFHIFIFFPSSRSLIVQLFCNVTDFKKNDKYYYMIPINM